MNRIPFPIAYVRKTNGLYSYFFLSGILALITRIGISADTTDLEKIDPFKIERKVSPYEDCFVRIESSNAQLTNLALVCISTKLVILNFKNVNRERRFLTKWEWRDVTGDGKPELLLWYTVDFGKGTSNHLDVFYIEKNGGKATGSVSIMYSRSAFHVYPSQPKFSGELVFEKSTISWIPNADNKAPEIETKWTWQQADLSFVNPKFATAKPETNGQSNDF